MKNNRLQPFNLGWVVIIYIFVKKSDPSTVANCTQYPSWINGLAVMFFTDQSLTAAANQSDDSYSCKQRFPGI